MALRHLAWIAERLMAAGRAGNTAVTLVAKATLADQQIVETTLECAAEDAAKAHLEAPSIIAVGDVVGLRAALDPAATPEARARAALKFLASRDAEEAVL